ncbi:uncharacterized protein V6R79_013976 [Siganus canaliculatus]
MVSSSRRLDGRADGFLRFLAFIIFASLQHRNGFKWKRFSERRSFSRSALIQGLGRERVYGCNSENVLKFQLKESWTEVNVVLSRRRTSVPEQHGSEQGHKLSPSVCFHSDEVDGAEFCSLFFYDSSETPGFNEQLVLRLQTIRIQPRFLFLFFLLLLKGRHD